VHRRLDGECDPALCVPVIQLVVCTLAAVTSLSRIADNMHHPADVACGAALGVIVALWNVRCPHRAATTCIIVKKT